MLLSLQLTASSHSIKMAPKPKTATPVAATVPTHSRASNDAFGDGSPHWNLPFPEGRLTAAEILAYCPHWLKSVDVVDRLVSNGAKAKVIAAMLNRFRILPSAKGISSNSVCIMMQCAMRAANFEAWTMGDHSSFTDTRALQWDVESLDVSGFRSPHVTHPKTGSKKIENVPALPLQFRKLAHNVQQHPLGHDALDLTRCVLYAVDHPDESWLFPTDFERLVDQLGGPQSASHLHSDTSAFERAISELFSSTERRGLTVAPITKRVHFADPHAVDTDDNINMRLRIPVKTEPGVSKKRIRVKDDDDEDDDTAPPSDTKRTRRSGRTTQTHKNMRESDTDTDRSTLKRSRDDDDDDEAFSLNQKKCKVSTTSTRVMKRSRGEEVSDDDEPSIPRPKKRRIRSVSSESEFIDLTTDTESPADENNHIDLTEESLSPDPNRRVPQRASAQQSQRLTKKAIRKEMPRSARLPRGFTRANNDEDLYALPAAPAAPAPPAPPARTPAHLIDPQLRTQAAAWVASRPAPILARAPQLSSNRLVVDDRSIFLYAAEGCTTRQEMWDSALSSTRFKGPRRSAPFRELYRLTDPAVDDESDWAENIRWAKEQFRAFGVKTWTEYDYHLEQVTEIRRETMWVSREVGGG